MTGKPALAFVVFVATACTPVRVAPGASLDREELAIYPVVIDSVLETKGDPFVVMAESTAVVGLSVAELESWKLRRDSTAFGAAFGNLIVRNRTPVRVPGRTLSGREIRAFGRAFDVQRDRDESRDYVLRSFEPVRWIHILSRPGIDPERGRAVIFAGSGCGGWCGFLRLILLTRTPRGGRWYERIP